MATKEQQIVKAIRMRRKILEDMEDDWARKEKRVKALEKKIAKLERN